MHKKVLAIASHPDDIEGGCYGTLCKYKQQGFRIHYLVLTCGGDSGNADIRRKEQEEVADLLGATVKFQNLQSALLNNNSGRETIQAIEDAIKVIKPDIIFTHSKNDVHQDHRLVNEATISATRFFQGQVYCYEAYSSLRYFQPTVFYRIDEFFEDKLRAISLFTSQGKKFYMNPEVITGIAVFRAAQSGKLGKAEAFEIGRIIR